MSLSNTTHVPGAPLPLPVHQWLRSGLPTLMRGRNSMALLQWTSSEGTPMALIAGRGMGRGTLLMAAKVWNLISPFRFTVGKDLERPPRISTPTAGWPGFIFQTFLIALTIVTGMFGGHLLSLEYDLGVLSPLGFSLIHGGLVFLLCALVYHLARINTREYVEHEILNRVQYPDLDGQ